MPFARSNRGGAGRDFTRTKNLVVYLRADDESRWKNVEALIDRAQRNGITRFSPRTEPPKR